MSTTRARTLRKNLSPPEKRLWLRLRRLRAHGYHFRNQASVGRFVLDFACLPYHLAVEVDGDHHGEPAQAAHDAVRDAILVRAGFTVLRVPASVVMRNVDGVVEAIVGWLEAAPPPKFRSRVGVDREGGAPPP